MYRPPLPIVVALVLVPALAGCNASTSPSGPSPVSQASRPLTAMQLTGFVIDSGYRPLAGARVEVIHGPQAGTSAIADATGQFSLTGEFDSTTAFRASADGYATATQPWSCSVGYVSGPDRRTPVVGILSGPARATGGHRWSLHADFVADPACADVPTELHTRTYAATIVPEARTNVPANTSFALTVSGAPFLRTFDSFSIGVAGDYLGFFLHGGHDPPIVEEIAANTYLAFSGNASASLPSPAVSTISAAFDGWINYCEMRAPMGSGVYNCGTSNWTGEPIPGASVTYGLCQSKNHRLILARR